jgi:hypothetical protein
MLSRKEKRKLRKKTCVNVNYVNIELFESNIDKKKLENIISQKCFYKTSGRYENIPYNETKQIIKHLKTANDNKIYSYYMSSENKKYYIKYYIDDGTIQLKVKRIENGDFLTIYIKNGFQYQPLTRYILDSYKL